VPLALTEVFYTMLLLAGCRLLIARTPLALIAAGLVFGVATLVKAQTLVVVPLVFAIALGRAPGFWKRLPAAVAQATLVIALAAAVVAPWTVRNHRVLGEWVAISTNGGITLLTGNNDTARGGFTPEDPVVKALDARTDLPKPPMTPKPSGWAWPGSRPIPPP
jgi:4-amino-4-deoxy-L-arabinose transferase-like glycosyltransferase